MKDIHDFSSRDLFKKITAYPEARYSSIDLTGLACVAIQWLQEHQVPASFENIVVSLFRMFPGKFSLEGFPEYPDATRVNRSLLQLRPKYRNWARGNVQKGFILSDKGLKKVKEVLGTITGEPSVQAKGRHPAHQKLPRTIDFSKEILSIEQSSAFQKWKQGKLAENSNIELLNVFGAFAYTPFRAVKERAAQLIKIAAQLERDDMVAFLKAVQKLLRERTFKISDGGGHA